MPLSSKQPFLAFVIETAARLWSRLPLRFVQALGSAVGALGDRVANRERRIAEVNLELCFPHMQPSERLQLRRRSLQETAKAFVEMPAAWFRSTAYWRERIDLNGIDLHLREVLAQGRGMIAAGPHLGNWEVVLLGLMQIAPVVAMYRPPRQAALEPMLLAGRQKENSSLVPATARGVRAIHAALKGGSIVGILPDQAPKHATQGAGEFAPFFGIPAYTMTLLPRLAARTGAPVVFVFAERLDKGRFRMRWYDAHDDIASPDPATAVAALNAGVEACVRQYPHQYLWSYKRFMPAPPGTLSPYIRT